MPHLLSHLRFLACQLSRILTISATPGNAARSTHCDADLQFVSYPLSAGPDPERLLSLFTAGNIPQKANNWQGYNTPRWRSEEYDSLFRRAQRELDPAKRASQFIRLNDLLV